MCKLVFHEMAGDEKNDNYCSNIPKSILRYEFVPSGLDVGGLSSLFSLYSKGPLSASMQACVLLTCSSTVAISSSGVAEGLLRRSSRHTNQSQYSRGDMFASA